MYATLARNLPIAVPGNIAVTVFAAALLARQPALPVQLVIRRCLSAVMGYAKQRLAPALIMRNALVLCLIAVTDLVRPHLAPALIITNAQPE